MSFLKLLDELPLLKEILQKYYEKGTPISKTDANYFSALINNYLPESIKLAKFARSFTQEKHTPPSQDRKEYDQVKLMDEKGQREKEKSPEDILIGDPRTKSKENQKVITDRALWRFQEARKKRELELLEEMRKAFEPFYIKKSNNEVEPAKLSRRKRKQLVDKIHQLERELSSGYDENHLNYLIEKGIIPEKIGSGKIATTVQRYGGLLRPDGKLYYSKANEKKALESLIDRKLKLIKKSSHK